MSLQAAMRFLDAIGERTDLAMALEAALAGIHSYEDLTRSGAQFGFVFSAEELDQAFRHRCVMLQLHRRAVRGGQGPAATPQGSANRPALRKDDPIAVPADLDQG